MELVPVALSVLTSSPSNRHLSDTDTSLRETGELGPFRTEGFHFIFLNLFKTDRWNWFPPYLRFTSSLSKTITLRGFTVRYSMFREVSQSSNFHAHFVSIVHGLSSCVATATEGFPRAQLQFSTCSGGNQVRCSTLAFPRDQLQASPNPGTWVRRNDVTIIHPLELRSFVPPKRTRDLSQDRQSYSFHSVCVLSPHWGNALQQDHWRAACKLDIICLL